MARNKTYKIWTVEEDNLLREKSKGNGEYSDLCRLFFPDRTPSSLQSHAKKIGALSGHRYRKNFFDEHFWDKPNELNCFWAGTMAADASISKTKSGESQGLNWEISIRDEDYMDKFIKSCNFSGGKYYHKKLTKKGNPCKTVKIGINCKKWVDRLGENFNVTQQKANRIALPNTLDENLINCWLVGYINGDGCISLSEYIGYGGKQKKNLSISFTSACFNIIKWIEEFSNKKFIPEKKKNRKMRTTQGVNPYYHVAVAGQSAIQMFILLSQYDLPVLERKWRDEGVLGYIKEKYLKSPEAYVNYLWNKDSFIYKYLTS